jgi:hypothetical protein
MTGIDSFSRIKSGSSASTSPNYQFVRTRLICNPLYRTPASHFGNQVPIWEEANPWKKAISIKIGHLPDGMVLLLSQEILARFSVLLAFLLLD